MSMEPIRIQNMIRTAVWCVLLALCGGVIAFTVNADSYLERYYSVGWYALLEAAVTVLTVLFAFLWWRCATSESVNMQDMRMWISEHGALAPWLSFIPVWLIAGVFHVISFTAFTVGTSGYRIYSMFVLPFLYMALSYALPPVEISETILPFTGIAQKIMRGVFVVLFLGLGIWIVFYDFFA